MSSLATALAPAPRAVRPRGMRRLAYLLIVRGTALTLALFGLVAGLVLGPLFAIAAAFGWGRAEGAQQLVPGPGAWVAHQVRARYANPFLAIPGAMMAGAAAGLVTGPFWFDFLGWSLGRFVGEALACRCIELD
ncbi:MAG: hypothetical protein AMXMBFR33_31400 [Candidatus Xenobia bacterium]